MSKSLLRLPLLRRNFATLGAQFQTGDGSGGTFTKTTTSGSTESDSHTKLKMSGWQLHNYGDVEDLQFGSHVRTPQIRDASECLVRVHATTVNPIDVLMLRGYGATIFNALRCQPGAIEFPITLGREFCGEVVQTGMAVSKRRLPLGQRVWGVVPLHRTGGAHAQYVSVPDYCVGAAPAELSNEDAAAVLYAGLTAWSGLYISGHVAGVCGALTANGGDAAHKRILVLGGSGSVGSMAIQMLKARGVQVLATCSEDAVELVRGYGADHVVDYRNPVAMETLRDYAPYDIILDCAGQGVSPAQTLNLKFHQYITFSSPLLRNIDESGLGLGLLRNVAHLVETNARALSEQGGLVKYAFFAPAPQGIEHLRQLVQRKKLLPVIDSRFNIQEMPQAFARVQSGHLRGKVVVSF